MLETAMLKVFATEHLWTIVNDTLQVWGGKGYFCDQPLERWMRDARINTIGEGANDVLKAFIAVVGCRGPGEYLKSLRDDLMGGRWSFGKLAAGAGRGRQAAWPRGYGRHADGAGASRPDLHDDAHTLGRLVQRVRPEAAARVPGAEGRGDVRAGRSWSTSGSRTSPSTCTWPRAC